ncbi:DUF6499 domain-containing protein [Bradyrhizobium sp. CCH5-F6]|uniref:transcriptional regulator domain-containing protein n=1 Tax=Bradyrhizobium sp. CCH5-F6 TaxID=1768753 RepID=UPI001FDA1F26|nr:DUF6499 domain-containing protein [Bradyrhizobium sp. CCH5-F6]
MSKFNWRSSDDYYNRVEEGLLTGLAWECLRRNPDFQSDCRARPPSAGIRHHWGLVFRS